MAKGRVWMFFAALLFTGILMALLCGFADAEYASVAYGLAIGAALSAVPFLYVANSDHWILQLLSAVVVIGLGATLWAVDDGGEDLAIAAISAGALALALELMTRLEYRPRVDR